MTEHFFKTLKIENFRGIKSLEINDLARVNLFVGENNCGKTTVLEAAFILGGLGSPNLIINMQNDRGIKLTEGSDIKDFFYNRSHQNGLTLSGMKEREKRNLKIFPLHGNLQTGQVSVASGNGAPERAPKFPAETSMMGHSLIGLDYRFEVFDLVARESRKYHAETRWTEVGDPRFSAFSDDSYKEVMLGNGLYLKSKYDPRLVDEMLNRKQKDFLMQALKSVDSKIKDIKVGMQGLVSVDIGLDSFVPINLMGDGVMRILSILSGIEGVSNGMLFVDEIENGLHVNTMRHAWDVMLAQSRSANAQLFLTTHSGDAIKSLHNALNSRLFPDAVACYRLVKFPNDVVRAYRYSGEQLGMALDSDTDIRF